jgi:universal stress protein A
VGRLIVLHVAEPPVVAPGETMIHLPRVDSREAIAQQLRRIQAPNTKIPVEHRLEEGAPVAEILCVARETKSDLIVMGTHGRTGLAHLLMGSVAEQWCARRPVQCWL